MSRSRLSSIAALWVLLLGCGGDPGIVGNNTNLNNNGNNSAGVCGNGVLDPGEECDDGGGNSDIAPDACRTSCSLPTCGDWVTDTGEQCDDGAQNSDNVPDSCRSDCTLPRCGDGVVDVGRGETCDDGNADAGDGCSPDCHVEFCGNGLLDPGEVCDDGNYQSGDGCSADCQSDETCGNGQVDWVTGEECDDGNQEDGDGCNVLCLIERCGNGYLEPGEVCDDGNNVFGDGCSADCESDETCGNGYLDWLMGEQCDDGNALSHDGCTSGCRYEVPTWTERVFGHTPDGRINAAMAFDAGRGVLVLYGGYSSTGSLADTWEWSGGVWRQLSPAGSPGPRAYHQMVYDASRRRVVLFGGGTELFWLEDSSLWEWDGKTWTQRITSNQPPPRAKHQMAYDAGRGRVVVQGGFWYDLVEDRPVWVKETWEWDGVAGEWTMASPGSSSLGAQRNVMAYDPQRGVTLLVDQGSASSGDATTWEWNGAVWIQRAAPLPAAARPAQGIRYHSGLGQIVLQGVGTWVFDGTAWQELTLAPSPPSSAGLFGSDLAMAHDSVDGRVFYLHSTGWAGFDQDLWQLHVSGWSLVPSAAEPPGRRYPAAAFDGARGRTVMFGGQGESSVTLDDTWEWDGQAWEERVPEHRPPARTSASLVFDQAREEVVLFGGRQGAVSLQDTWVWDGSDWYEVTPALSPSPRNEAAMAYDPVRERIVLFGGLDGMELGDTWEWDGQAWVEVTPAIAPPARFQAAMAFDPALGALLLHGGCDITYFPKGDIWSWDGSDWVMVGEDLSTARTNHSIVLDEVRGQVLQFAGFITASYSNNTLQWNGHQFVDLLLESPPEKRISQVMVFDPLRAETVVFGGWGQSMTFLSDTWVLSWSAPRTSYEVCLRGMDLDNDGLVGCDDPDCWAHCTPRCPPWLDSCDPLWPHCGDGHCSPLESCRLCPQDCGHCQVCGDFFCDPLETCATCPGDCGPC